MVRYLFQGPGLYEVADLVPKKGTLQSARDALMIVARLLPEISGLDDEGIEQRFRDVAEKTGQKLGNLLMPLRVAVTGSRVSPPLFESIRIVGVEAAAQCVTSAIDRLDDAIGEGE